MCSDKVNDVLMHSSVTPQLQPTSLLCCNTELCELVKVSFHHLTQLNALGYATWNGIRYLTHMSTCSAGSISWRTRLVCE